MPDPLNEDEDPRNYSLYLGTVERVDDPKGMGRIRFSIPGFIEPLSAWALPINTGFGGKHQRGVFNVPEIGSTVAVQFIQGDIDQPVYQGAYFAPEADRDPTEEEKANGVTGKVTDTEVPTPVKEVTPEDRPKVRAIETEKFYIYIDDRDGSEEDPDSGKERLLIQFKDDDEVFIEVDGLNRGIQISATAAVALRSTGLVSIEGAQVQIQGRIVNSITTKEI